MKRNSASQRGLSIVELMVGLTIGLIVVAAATQVVVTQLNENRKLLTEMQVQQDLRATADIITRELRRAGARTSPETGIWQSESAPAQANALSAVTPETGANSELRYSYRRTAGDTIGALGYGFQLSAGRIQSRIGGAWQDLTDARTLKVTSFTVKPVLDPAPLPLPCPKFCPDALESTACWPTITVRRYEVAISAVAANDPTVTRSIRTTATLRNDVVGFNNAASPAQACPL